MSAINETVFDELHDLFEDLKKVHHEDKIQDSGDTSQNTQATQNNVDKMISYIDGILTNASKDDDKYLKVLAMKSSLLYEKAKLLLSLEDNNGCQENLEKALQIISELHDNPQISYLYLRLMNHLAYVVSKRGDLPKSKAILEKITFNTASSGIIVYSTEELFAKSEIIQTEAAIKLHRLTINNLQMLGWVCCKMGLDEEYALQQHVILQHQLNFGECDPVDWSTRCARIAVLYLSKFRWVAARYHLSAAGSILDQLERDMVPHPELGKAQAELARGWIYYGMRLFDASKSLEADRRCNVVFGDEEAGVGVEAKQEEEGLPEPLTFSGLEIKLVDIPATFLRTADDARALFFQTHVWLKRARMFYTLRDHPYIYVNCVLDLSELYRYLAYFEPDLESQYNVQKRRAEALETLSGILKDVRPQCYIAVSVEILRELAEVHLELMGLNLRRMYELQGVSKGEELSRRIDAVSDIHTKLERFGNLLGHGNLEDESVEVEAQCECSCNPLSNAAAAAAAEGAETKMTKEEQGQDEVAK